MELSGIDLSRLVNKTRQNIYILQAKGKLIKLDNGKYETEDPINLDYILSCGITKNDIESYVLSKAEKKGNKTKKVNQGLNKKHKKKTIIPKKVNQVEFKKNQKKWQSRDNLSEEEFENISGLPAKLMNMTMKKIVMRYGGQMMLDKYATILNKLMQAAERDQKVQEKRMELVDKDFVVSRLFLYLENLSKLLFDFPEGCIDNIIAKIESNKDNFRNEIVNEMRKELGILINQSKNNINRELDNLLNKYDKDKDNEKNL